MPTYLIPLELVQELQNIQRVKCARNDKNLYLYNKNGLRWQKFTNIKKAQNHFAFLGETKSLDNYWSGVINQLK